MYKLLFVFILSCIFTVSIFGYFEIDKKSRDAKRKQDILAISQGLESKFNTEENLNCKSGLETYCQPKDSWFANKLPTDPKTFKQYEGVQEILDGTKKYKICASLENGEKFCRSNQR